MTDAEYATATAGMTRDQIDGITSAEWDGVVLHTTWFVLYLAADVLYCLIYWPHMEFIKGTKFWPKAAHSSWRDTPALYPVFEWAVWFMMLIGVGSYVLRLSIFLYAHNGEDRFDQFTNPRTFVQQLSNVANASMKPAFWFFIVMALNAFVMPAEVGLVFNIRLTRHNEVDYHHGIKAHTWKTTGIKSGEFIAAAFKILAVMVVFSFAFVPYNTSTVHLLPLAQALEGKPYAFIFAPFWVGMMNSIGVGMGLAVMRRYLGEVPVAMGIPQYDRHKPSTQLILMVASGITFLISCTFCCWTVIPTAPQPLWSACIALLAFPFWVICSHYEWEQSNPDRARLLLFLTVWLACIVIMPFSITNDASMNIILVLLLSLYDVILPYRADYDGMTISVAPTTFELRETTVEEMISANVEKNRAEIESCFNGIYTKRLLKLGAGFLIFAIIHNLAKVPCFLFLNPATNVTSTGDPSWGMESSPDMYYLIGYRGEKLFSDPYLFLAPHTMLGCTLLSLYGTVLWGLATKKQTTQSFCFLTVIFALHICPVATGLPGVTINKMCIFLVIPP